MSEKRKEIEATGSRIAFVHMSPPEEAKSFFEKYRLPDVAHFSDPKQTLYRAFDLRRQNLWQFFGLPSIWHTFQSAVLRRHGMGMIAGDERQMPGAFLIHNGQIVKSHHYNEPWDHPNFVQLASYASS